MAPSWLRQFSTFSKDILLLEGSDGDDSIHGYRRKLYFTLKFQQLTGPVMAKGLEDTACYVYTRFISANEVGGSPADFGISISDFHRRNEDRAAHWPHSMLSTSTHDTKRSEDVRARLDVLSEMPKTWATQVMKWRRINRTRKAEVSGRPSGTRQQRGIFAVSDAGRCLAIVYLRTKTKRREFIDRIQQYMEKAVHEAKVNVSWLNPNPEYIHAMNSFLERDSVAHMARQDKSFLGFRSEVHSASHLLRADEFAGSNSAETKLSGRAGRLPGPGNVGLQSWSILTIGGPSISKSENARSLK